VLILREVLARQPAAPQGEREAAPASGSPAEQALLAKFVRAYESGDSDDVCVSMPPVPLEYHGRDDVARFYASINRRGRTYDLVPTRAKARFDNSVLPWFGLPQSLPS
jgi:RNA polymerase sigma-70 factor (ECF subfamily)